jgi:hypothetical protein
MAAFLPTAVITSDPIRIILFMAQIATKSKLSCGDVRWEGDIVASNVIDVL